MYAASPSRRVAAWAVAYPKEAALYAVAAFTGLRLGELRALRWRDIDWTLRLVHVRRNYVAGVEQAPKSGKVRSVPLIDQAAQALEGLSRRERFIGSDDLIFPSPTGHYADDARIRRDFRVACARSGIDRLRFHDLRHSFGTLTVQAFSLADVQAYMGHANIATTMIYVHHVPANDAANRLSELVRLREIDAELEGLAAR